MLLFNHNEHNGMHEGHDEKIILCGLCVAFVRVRAGVRGFVVSEAIVQFHDFYCRK